MRRVGRRRVRGRGAVRARGRVPPIAGLAAVDADRRAAPDLRPPGVDAPGPIVLVNSFASGGALFSAVLRVRWN